MTEAFKQGFMSVMRKFAQAEPAAAGTQVKTYTPPEPDKINLLNWEDRPFARIPADARDIETQGPISADMIDREGTYPSVYADDRLVTSRRGVEGDVSKAINDANDALAMYVGKDVGIHTPIQASQIAKNFLQSEPAISKQTAFSPLVGNWLLQRGVDALPDPGPGVRQPTPYELAEYYRTVIQNFINDEDKTTTDLLSAAKPLTSLVPGYDGTGALKRLDAEGPIAAALSTLRGDPALQDELARRLWNQATNAVPISVTSAGRETPVKNEE